MQADVKPNQFTFTGDGINVTYYPVKPGPIVVPDPDPAPADPYGKDSRDDSSLLTGNTSTGPTSLLAYQGTEGNLSFVGQQVEKQDSPFGQLLTVTVKPSVDAGVTRLSIVLPQINMAGERERNFETFAIKTTSYGILPHVGAALSYQVVPLQAKAAAVILPV